MSPSGRVRPQVLNMPGPTKSYCTAKSQRIHPTYLRDLCKGKQEEEADILQTITAPWIHTMQGNELG